MNSYTRERISVQYWAKEESRLNTYSLWFHFYKFQICKTKKTYNLSIQIYAVKS